MSARLRSDIWVSAYLRRVAVEGATAVLRRRGAAEAGGIFVIVDRLDGAVALYTPGPSDETWGERRWIRSASADRAEIETRLERALRFDPDIWIVEVEDREGRSWLELAEA